MVRAPAKTDGAPDSRLGLAKDGPSSGRSWSFFVFFSSSFPPPFRLCDGDEGGVTNSDDDDGDDDDDDLAALETGVVIAETASSSSHRNSGSIFLSISELKMTRFGIEGFAVYESIIEEEFRFF